MDHDTNNIQDVASHPHENAKFNNMDSFYEIPLNDGREKNHFWNIYISSSKHTKYPWSPHFYIPKLVQMELISKILPYESTNSDTCYNTSFVNEDNAYNHLFHDGHKNLIQQRKDTLLSVLGLEK